MRAYNSGTINRIIRPLINTGFLPILSLTVPATLIAIAMETMLAVVIAEICAFVACTIFLVTKEKIGHTKDIPKKNMDSMITKRR